MNRRRTGRGRRQTDGPEPPHRVDPAPAIAAGDGPADNVLALTHILSNRIGRAFHAEVETRHGLSLPEWRVILTLTRFPGATAIEITNRWAMDKMTVARAIRRLEAAGRVTRRRKPADRRSYALTLTAAGRKVYAQVVPSANARYREIVACLSRAEIEALKAALAKLIGRASALDD